MKKSLLSLVCIGLMTISIATVHADTIKYSKYSYVEEAIKHNFDLMQIEDKLVDETAEFKTAIRISKTIEEMTWDEFDDNYEDSASRAEAMSDKLYNPLKEGKEYHDKYVEAKQKRDEIRLEAEKNYFDYINALNVLKAKTENFDLVKERYEAKVLEEKIGQASKLELLGYEKTYNDSYVEQLRAFNALEKSRNNFNLLIGQPINTPIELNVMDIELPEFELNSLEDTLAVLVENSYQRTSLKAELDRLEMDRVVKGRTSGFGEVKVELEQNQIAVDEVQEQLKDIALNIEYQLRTKYNETLAAANHFKSAKLQLEIDKTNLAVAEVKQKNQMLSVLEYIESKQSYDKALNEYYDAKLEAYVAMTEFNNFIALNSTPVPMNLK